MDILQRIIYLRDARGWTDYRLAKEAGIPQSTIANLYKRANAPAVPTLEALCRAFGISLSQFFAEEDETGALTSEQQELLRKWVLLSGIQKEKTFAYIQGLLEK